jgi:hypothetical protein
MSEVPENDAPAPTKRESTEADGAGIDGEAFSPVVDPDHAPAPTPRGGEAATGGEPIVPGAMSDGGSGGGRHIARDPREDQGTVAGPAPGPEVSPQP